MIRGNGEQGPEHGVEEDGLHQCWQSRKDPNNDCRGKLVYINRLLPNEEPSNSSGEAFNVRWAELCCPDCQQTRTGMYASAAISTLRNEDRKGLMKLRNDAWLMDRSNMEIEVDNLVVAINLGFVIPADFKSCQ